MASEQSCSPVPPLTARLIETALPAAKDYELRDPAAPGLRVRVTVRGAKVFRWPVMSIRRVITIGHWTKTPRPGFVTLGEARTWLERLKDAHKAGRLEEVEAEIRALRPKPSPQRNTLSAEPGQLTVQEVVADFKKYIQRRRKRPEAAERPLDHDIVPMIGERPIASITPIDCRQVVEAVVARNSPTQAGVVLAVLKQLFNFAWSRGDLAANPTAPLRDPGALGVVKNVCIRYLTPDEIVAFWNALDAYKGLTPTVRIGLRLLLLLGVRTGELLQATWPEVDFDAATWTIPVAHQKCSMKQEQVARPWTVPLPPMALKYFRELEGLAKSFSSPFVMASFHAVAPGQAVTEKSLNHAMRRLFTNDPPLLSFPGERPTPHDLRRTCRTHLGTTLRVPWHIAERCLNHSLGKITAIYDQGDYLDERREALEKWAAYIERLVAPAESKVAFLPAAGGGPPGPSTPTNRCAHLRV